jgi:hypothetical protein
VRVVSKQRKLIVEVDMVNASMTICRRQWGFASVALLVPLTCLLLSTHAAPCSPPDTQTEALNEFYSVLHGGQWTWGQEGSIWNFTQPCNPCSGWQGVSCSPCATNFSEIIAINISSFGAYGKIPQGLLQNFTFLSLFDISDNSISGPLPSVSSLADLSLFSVESNALTGTVPSDTFDGLNKLLALFLNDNYFTGSIPESSFSSEVLKYVYLSDNGFTGQLPEVIGAKNLEFVYVDSNSLTGSLPTSLIDLTRLAFLSVSDNLLSGNVDVIGNWTLIEYLSLRGNRFVGSLPASVNNCRNLSFFRLDINMLTGKVPSTLSYLAKLQGLTISGNRFTGHADFLFQHGKGPHDFPLLSSINMDNNEFSGTIPATIFSLPAIRLLSLSQNCFHGSIPSSVCNASHITSLVLDGLSSGSSCRQYLLLGLSPAYVPSNFMSGSIPSCILTLPNISVFHISGNGFRVPFASFASTVSSSLQDISLSYNQITGTIPYALQTMEVSYRDFSYNRIGGTIEKMSHLPPTNITSNYSLYLDVNRLSGFIPDEFHDTFYQINILSGNLFECTGNSIPLRDPSASSYVCGSHQLNESQFAATSVCGSFFLLLFIAWYQKRRVRGTAKSLASTDVGAASTRYAADERPSDDKDGTVDAVSYEHPPVRPSASLGPNERKSSSSTTYSEDTTRNSFERGSVFQSHGSLSTVSSLTGSHYQDVSVATEKKPSAIGNSIDHAAELYDKLNLFIHERLEALVYSSTGCRLFTKEILEMPKLFRFIKLLHQFRQIFFILLGACILFLLPLYCLFSWYPTYGVFTDYSYKYGWASTAAYATGNVPSVCMIIIWIFMAILSVWRLLTIKGLLKIEENLIGIRFKTADDQVKSSRYLVYRQRKKQYQENKTWTNYFALGHSFKVFALCWSVTIIDVVAMVGLNIGYVIGELSGLSYGIKFVLQGATALTKLIWNFIVLRYLIRRITIYKGDPKDKKVNLYIALVAFNNIAAPVIATMMTDSRCFRSVIIPNSPIISTFNIISCGVNDIFSSNLQTLSAYCNKDQSDSLSFSFAPPFIYSYQCGSAIITDFVPMFNYSYSLLLLWPLIQVILTRIDHRGVPRWLLYHLPGTLWPMADHKLFKKMMNPDIEIIQQLLHLFLMLTFGVTCVQLAVVICFSAITSSIVNQVLVVRFIRMRTVQRKRSIFCVFNPMESVRIDPSTAQAAIRESNATRRSDVSMANNYTFDNGELGTSMDSGVSSASVLGLLENACSGSWRRLLNGGILVFIGAVSFYAVMIFDAASEGGDWGNLSGLWVPLFCIVPPTIFYSVRYFYCKKRACGSNDFGESIRILSGRFLHPLGNQGATLQRESTTPAIQMNAVSVNGVSTVSPPVVDRPSVMRASILEEDDDSSGSETDEDPGFFVKPLSASSVQ